MSVRAMRGLHSLGLVLLTATITFAEEAGHGGHGEHHAPGIDSLLFPVINFAVYLFIIVRYVIPAARAYLLRRQEDAVAAAREAATTLGAAEASVSDVRRQLANVAAERDVIINDLVAIANVQAERDHAQAEDAGKRRVNDAALLAEQERRRAIAEVRAEVAAQATALAERRIRQALSPDDQVAFVRQFIESTPAR